jgi:hypothetical protein
MTEDHVQATTDAVRELGGDLSTVARHLDSIDFLTPAEGTRLTLALVTERRSESGGVSRRSRATLRTRTSRATAVTAFPPTHNAGICSGASAIAMTPQDSYRGA